MAKVTLSNITSRGITAINNNFQTIATYLENVLSRNGDSPNQMTADIDLNSNDLLNVGTVNTDILVLDGSQVTPASNLTALPDADLVAFTPAGTIAATNVQDAIEELDTETNSKIIVVASATTPDETQHQVWLDTSGTPDLLKIYDGSGWVLVTDATQLANYATTTSLTSGLATKEDTLSAGTTANITGDDTTAKKWAGDQINAATGMRLLETVEISTTLPSGVTAVAHSSGSDVRFVSVYIECETAEHNWSVGDRIHLTSLLSQGADIVYRYFHWDDSEVRLYSSSATWRAFDKTAGTIEVLTSARWSVHAQLWR